MEVNLPPEVESKLARLAVQRGTDAQGLARTAIESFVDYDDWFIREVEKGLAQIEQGAVLTHEAVGARLEQRLAKKQSHS
jgi:predicted transcriptional regulator